MRVLFLMGLFVSHFALASMAGKFGLGFIIGDPTAISAKYWTDKDKALDLGLSYMKKSGINTITVFADHLWHFPNTFRGLEAKGKPSPFLRATDAYIGVGAVIGIVSKGDTGFSARLPLGAEWRSKDPMIGVFLELVPTIALVPSTDVTFSGGLGARFYF